MKTIQLDLQKILAHAVVAVAIALACASPAHALSVLPIYLDQVIDDAAVAFQGKCVSNRSERDPATGFIVTFTTFEVSDVLKGDVAAMHTIKQLGGSLPSENLNYKVEGIPTFTIGQEYVVFLAGASHVGFSSPIGLSQGHFRVTDEQAARRVSNGRDLREMTSRMAADLPATAQARFQKASSGSANEMDLDDFKQAVRKHVGAKR